MRFPVSLLLLALLALGPSPARAEIIEDAFERAIDQFESALPKLPKALFGVDVAAYRDALTLRRFASRHWGGTMVLSIEAGTATDPSCARFAAFVRLPPNDGTVTLVLCPQFSSPGADTLRTLTILHELVHVVAGPDECRAMAFAARVEQLAHGRHTNVSRYWAANGCEGAGFSLP